MINKPLETEFMAYTLLMITYKPLETEFMADGFRHTQIKREGDFAIFHKVGIKGVKHPKSFDAGFETVIITRHDGYEIGGVKVEPAECYSSSSTWGVKGWTYKTLYSAQCKFDIITGKTQPVAITSENETSEPVSVKPSKIDSTLYVFPLEFSTKDFAEANKIEYSDAFLFIKESVNNNTIKFLREERRAAKGKLSKIFAKA